jgi:hypothetical protein
MTLLEECRDAVKILVRLGYENYEPLVKRIQWSIDEEQLEKREIENVFKGDDQLL